MEHCIVRAKEEGDEQALEAFREKFPVLKDADI